MSSLTGAQAQALRRIKRELFVWNERANRLQGGSPAHGEVDASTFRSLVEGGFVAVADREYSVVVVTAAGRAALAEVS
jgi:hypothetical protein